MLPGKRTFRIDNVTAYDPLTEPDPEEWQELDEANRIELVSAYHREARVELPNLLLHATIHVTVENQVTLGAETPVRATLDRLMREGLDRHEAVHAIGTVLASHIYDLLGGPERRDDANEPYYDELGRLTADRWRQQSE